MTEIVLAAPYCAPHRDHILSTLHGHGVTSARIVGDYALDAEGNASGGGIVLRPSLLTPVRQVYHVRVSPQAAAWAEYLLLRTGKYELLSRPLEPRNERWAAKWGGAMPQPWAVGDCASKVAPAKPGAKPVQLKDDSMGARLLRQLRRGGAR